MTVGEGDTHLVMKQVSESNYRLLERELRDLALLSLSLQESCPDLPLAAQVATKASTLVER